MYTIYTVEHCSEAMLAKYPNPALYVEDSLYLFGETLEQVTGTAAELIIDVASYGLYIPPEPVKTYQYDELGEPVLDTNGEQVFTLSEVIIPPCEERGLLTCELDAEVDRLLLLMDVGEVQLSKAQGQYLYETRFKPVSEEVIL
jgi:hypothetical protein